MKLKLKSSSGLDIEPMLYEWPLPIESAIDIIQTILYVCADFPEIKLDIDIDKVDTKSYDAINKLFCLYNEAIGKQRPTSVPTAKNFASRDVLRHILELVYKASVKDSSTLNKCRPFSNEVYGETLYDMVCNIIDNVELSQNEVFIELGSGIGQVVLQRAATKSFGICWGIELVNIPSSYAIKMENNFLDEVVRKEIL